jgi:hypothetical protein
VGCRATSWHFEIQATPSGLGKPTNNDQSRSSSPKTINLVRRATKWRDPPIDCLIPFVKPEDNQPRKTSHEVAALLSPGREPRGSGRPRLSLTLIILSPRRGRHIASAADHVRCVRPARLFMLDHYAPRSGCHRLAPRRNSPPHKEHAASWHSRTKPNTARIRSAAPSGLDSRRTPQPGVPLRSTPGYSVSPLRGCADRYAQIPRPSTGAPLRACF